MSATGPGDSPSTNGFDELLDKILHSPNNMCTLDELRLQFAQCIRSFDHNTNKNDSIPLERLPSLCEEMGLPISKDEGEMMDKMDADGSGTLERAEWVAWWLNRVSTQPNPQKQQEVIARNVFNKFDEDGSCAISTAEFRRLIEFLGADFRDSEVADAIKEIDQDGSGQIDREEFVRWWTNQSSTREAGGVVAIKLRKLANRAMQVFDTDIHTAVWNNDLALVKMFLGIDPKKMSNLADMSEYGDHMTPLHYASYQGNKEIVLELLRCNANVNVKNRFGFTPLFYASQRGFIEVCRALVEAGADPTLIGFDEDYPQFALCPADHVVDYPELESIFRRNQNCKEPETPSIGEISLTISTTGAAVLTLPPLIAISKLLVQSYSLTLFTSMTDQLPEEILAKTIPVSVDLEDPDRKIKDKRFMPETIDFKYEKKEQEMIVDALRRSENIVFNVVVTNALGNGLSTEHKAVKILRSASQQLATKSVSSETKSIASQSKSVVSSRRVPT